MGQAGILRQVALKNLRDMTYQEMLADVNALGEKPYRASQVYSWVFHRGATDISEMTDVSKTLRSKLSGIFYIGGVNVENVRTSSDGTIKFLSRLEDGLTIESVLIPEAGRLTLCVSTQAGCAMGCVFCLTGSGGLDRNLTMAEMAGQVFAAKLLIKPDERITNAVLMGMGEPLANYDNVSRFLSTLVDPAGFGLSHNKVTVSTAGLVPGIRRLGQETKVNLAVSLNAVDDATRERIMPINRRWPIEALMRAMREFCAHGKRHVTIEYVLLKNVNDSPREAMQLAALLKGLPCKVNLIPFNEFDSSRFQSATPERVSLFHKILMDAGQAVFVRSSKGVDILAACGQLRGEKSVL
ncbi:MAG: 23S rRNA (adenine(2503)-C(2))-methyltransferase RlmN [Deltaproteobacteria bacterium]|nr:23S rRNA (adenine(2503)-C(2))-methyltransferase RlmN [Deltaproteobacteria bacterium]